MYIYTIYSLLGVHYRINFPALNVQCKKVEIVQLFMHFERTIKAQSFRWTFVYMELRYLHPKFFLEKSSSIMPDDNDNNSRCKWQNKNSFRFVSKAKKVKRVSCVYAQVQKGAGWKFKFKFKFRKIILNLAGAEIGSSEHIKLSGCGICCDLCTVEISICVCDFHA